MEKQERRDETRRIAYSRCPRCVDHHNTAQNTNNKEQLNGYDTLPAEQSSRIRQIQLKVSVSFFASKIDAVKRKKKESVVPPSSFASHPVFLHVAIALVSTRFTREAQRGPVQGDTREFFWVTGIPSVTSPW